jgi:Carboxypeptidase regulatory-like domain
MKCGDWITKFASGKRPNWAARSVLKIWWPALPLIAIALLASALSAQTTGLGTISGRVTDPTGAVIPGAHITVTNTATGVAVSVPSNVDGLYLVGNLVPGPYKIGVSAKGYKDLLRQGITLVSDASETVDLSLAVGQSSQEVTVYADASLLNLSSGSDGQVVSTQQIEDTPTAGANPLLLLKFSSAIQTADASNLYMNGSYNAGAANSRIGTAGQVSKNEYMLDGAPDQYSGHNVAYAPPSDEVNEMFTDVTGFDSEVGKTLGTYTNVTSKTGTDQFHGDARWLYEDQRWQALTHFARVNIITACTTGTAAACAVSKAENLQPGTHENNWGGSIGGPVIIPHLFDGRRKKLFFFFGTVRDEFTGVTNTSVNVPTVQERGLNGSNADFSDLPGCPSACGEYTIFDPLTVAPVPGQTYYQRTPFAGNVIPASRINNPMTALFNAVLPVPNNGGGSGSDAVGLNGEGNYVYNQLQPQLFTAYTPRIDYALRDNDHIFARASKVHYLQDTKGFTTDDVDEGLVNQDALILSVGWTHIFTPNLVMDNTIGYSRYWNGLQEPGLLKFPATSLGLPSYLQAQAASSGFNGAPLVEFAGSTSSPYNEVGRNSYPANYDKIGNYRAGFTFVRGAHAIKAGAEYRMQVAIGTPEGNIDGLYNFDDTFTREFTNGTGNGSKCSGVCETGPEQLGLDYAAYLLGMQTSATLTTQVLWKRSSPYYALWGGDNWRITPKLTINTGLRFEFEYGPTESQNRQMMYFTPSLALPTASDVNSAYTADYSAYVAAIPAGLPAPPTSLNIQGGSVYAGVNGVGTRAWVNSWRLLPRFAAAYALRPTIVIRGGYGLFYDTNNALNQNPDLTGFSATTTTASTTDNGEGLNGDWVGANPYTGGSPVTNPFPNVINGSHFVQPLGSSLGGMAIGGNSWSFYPQNYVPSRQQRWNVTVEKQFGSSTVLHADYIGSWTSRLQVSQNLNSVPAAYFTGGNTLNPNNGALSGNVSPNPFSYTHMSDLATSSPVVYQNVLTSVSEFTSSNVAVAQLLKPYPQLTGLTEYAEVGNSKFNELNFSFRRRMSNGLSFAINYQQNWQNDQDYFANSFDTVLSWEPSNNSRPYRIAGIGTWELPFGKNELLANHGWMSKAFGGFKLDNAYEQEQGALIGFGNLIYTGGDPKNIKLAHPSYGEWFNTTNFDKVSADQLGAYNLRVFPTRVPGVRQQGYSNLNTNLERNVPLTERVNMKLRFECFDVFNHTLVSAPNTSPTSAQFGQVTGNAQSFSRFIQVQGRFEF